jgi:ribose transport system substrate-binding protein
MGVDVIAVTHSGFEARRQIEDIEKVLAKKPAVMVAIPTDSAATAVAFRKVAAAGVKLVFMDNVPDGMRPGRDYTSVVSGDNHGAGVASAHILASKLGAKGKIGAIIHGADFFVTRQRYENLKETLARHFPAIELVAEASVDGPDFRSEATHACAAMLAEHPDLDGVWAAWDELAEGVVAAARAAGRTDLAVTTVDYGERMARLMAAGDLIVGVSAQRPYDQGVTEALLAGYALLDKPAPPYVALPALTVTRESLIGAWRTVYHGDPPWL